MIAVVDYSKSHRDQLKNFSKNWSEEFWSFEEIEKSLAYDHIRAHLLLDGDKALGFIIYSIQRGESELLYLFIPRSLRQQGHGRRLLEAYFRACVDDQVEALFLEVRVSNKAAIALYQSFGYEVVGQRKRYYSDGETALMLKKDLC